MYACNYFVFSVDKIISSCKGILQAVVGGLTYKNDENFGTFQKHLLLKTHENSNGGRFQPQRPKSDTIPQALPVCTH